MEVKARNKQVKSILSKEFGRENVSVKNGRGTSWGWCDIQIRTPDPCPDKQFELPCSEYCKNPEPYAAVCKGNRKPIQGGWGQSARQEKWTEIREKVKELVKDVPFDTFTADDGYNTELTRMNTEVKFI